jgi:DNA-binding CsgD family transcriptional regulator
MAMNPAATPTSGGVDGATRGALARKKTAFCWRVECRTSKGRRAWDAIAYRLGTAYGAGVPAIQDESESVIVVVCTRAAVGEVLRQLRGGVAGTVRDTVAITAVAHVGTQNRDVPVRRASIDGDEAVAWLRAQHQLTDLQCVVLALRFRGWTNLAVSDALGIEVGTVKAHVHAAKQRIGATPATRIDMLFRRVMREVPAQPVGVGEDAAWRRMLHNAMRRGAGPARLSASASAGTRTATTDPEAT